MKNLHLDRLDQKLGEADKGWNKKELTEIKRFLVNAKDAELTSINPNVVARKTGLHRMKTLKSFLYLTKAGVFDLQWAVRCPHCTGKNQSADNLGSLVRDDHCPLCEKDFKAGFDQNVELTFRVNPTVGELEPLDPFEIALASFEIEPGIAMTLDPRETHHLVYDLEPGNYLLINRQHRRGVNFSVSADRTQTTQKFQWNFSESLPAIEVVSLKSGPLDLTVSNLTDDANEFLFAQLRSPDWTSAALTSTLQEFRDLFSQQMLSTKETFSIRNMTILFTDIKGSTAMYEQLGDSQAFYLVKEHFGIMEEAVKRNNGGIVKTIGDAVMAVFSIPDDAANAAHEMIADFDEFNKNNHLDNQIIIKVGIHSGPCIAVTLNERIDYFGTTVNIAARVQGLSDGRDIMISEHFHNECSDSVFQKANGWNRVSFSTTLKGLKDHYTIYKLSKD